MIFPIPVNSSIATVSVETESIETLVRFVLLLSVNNGIKHSLYYFNSQVNSKISVDAFLDRR